MREIKEDSNVIWGYNLQIILKWKTFLSLDQISFSKKKSDIQKVLHETLQLILNKVVIFLIKKII